MKSCPRLRFWTDLGHLSTVATRDSRLQQGASMNLAIIGGGAIGNYVAGVAAKHGHHVEAWIVRPARVRDAQTGAIAAPRFDHVAALPDTVEHVVDCAGHGALREHGPAVLRRGLDLTTVSLGALADSSLHDDLDRAAADGNARLHLATGAIGALDVLQAARVGGLSVVTYTGRKPPQGWRGSPAQDALDLDNLDQARAHFAGSAREAALRYPKNANVAAAVALAGIGFDQTQVELIADPSVSENIHEIRASGVFGQCTFEIRGRSLPDNPRSSALAAMSVLASLNRVSGRVVIG